MTSLRDYCFQVRGITLATAGEELGEPYRAVVHWSKTPGDAEFRIPRAAAMAKIAAWSKGQVTADSFYPLPDQVRGPDGLTPAPPSGSAVGAAPGAGGAAAPEGPSDDGSLAVANAVRPSLITLAGTPAGLEDAA